MSDISKSNKAPLFKTSTIATTDELKRMASNEGLAFVLSNNDSTDTISPYTNSDHAYSNFINSLAWAEAINESDIRTVVKVEGDKFLKTTTYPGFYVAGDKPALNKTNKSCFLDYRGTLWVVMGNWGRNGKGREFLYSAINFQNELPNPMKRGWQTLADGWVVASVAQVHQGTDDLSNHYMHVSTIDDAYNDYYELKYENQKTQAVRKCGAGKEEWTGTCCLYYKENHYDSVAGVTYDAGDFYKCTCAKCYHCLEMAKGLNMEYVFNSFTGTGPTGGAGEKCLSCDEDSFPTNCGPCSCRIELGEKYDRIIADVHLSERGIAMQNAHIAKEWNENLKGSSFCSLRGSFESIPPIEKLISLSAWGKPKEFELTGILLNKNSKSTIVRLVTQGNKGSEEIIGIDIKQVGQYMNIPSIPIDYIKTIWPDAKEEYFRVTKIGNAHKDIELITGPLLPMIKKRIMFSDIYTDTNVSSFDSYGIASLYDIKGRPFFPSSTASKQTARCTYKNIMSTTSSESDSKSKDSLSLSALNKSSNVGASLTAIKIASVNTISTDSSLRYVEIYAGNDESNINAAMTDNDNNTWTTISSSKPTSSITGESLSPQKTKIILTNNQSINVPISISKITNNQVLSSASIDIEVVIGQSNKV